MEQNQQWRRLSGERIQIPITEEVTNMLQREIAEGNEIRACIGTDSQVHGKQTAFATVIVFLRKGKGGFMYIRTAKTAMRMTIRQRMLLEVTQSVSVAYELCNIFSRF